MLTACSRDEHCCNSKQGHALVLSSKPHAGGFSLSLSASMSDVCVALVRANTASFSYWHGACIYVGTSGEDHTAVCVCHHRLLAYFCCPLPWGGEDPRRRAMGSAVFPFDSSALAWARRIPPWSGQVSASPVQAGVFFVSCYGIGARLSVVMHLVRLSPAG